MKRRLATMGVHLLFLFGSAMGQSQDSLSDVKSLPDWIPTKGYWIVVTKAKTPLSNMVHFYTNDNIEFYSEKIDGVELDIRDAKICKKLNRILDQSIEILAQAKSLKGQQLIQTAFMKKKRW